jgi:hypothetical protein
LKIVIQDINLALVLELIAKNLRKREREREREKEGMNVRKQRRNHSVKRTQTFLPLFLSTAHYNIILQFSSKGMNRYESLCAVSCSLALTVLVKGMIKCKRERIHQGLKRRT